MVASTLAEDVRREQWTLQRLEEAGMPGGEEDHRWIARNVSRALEPLGDHADHVLPAVLSGLLLEMGEDPSQSPELEGRWFPSGWLESTPALLRSGFPLMAWRLVEAGILVLEKVPMDPKGRWRVDAGRILQEFGDCYELGECLLFRNLARALIPLVEDRPDVTIVLAGLSPDLTRHWIRSLRHEWEQAGFASVPHLVKV